jgi:dolichol-phosphate mannosyltransferase
MKAIVNNEAPVLSVVIPVFNEEKNLLLLYERLLLVISEMKLRYELIFVNDGSSDNSLALIKQLASKDQQVYYLNFSRNFGHQIAVTAGLDHSKGTAVIIIDADLQDSPEVIKSLYEKYLQGYHVVYAKRNKRKGETVFKKITAKLFYRVLNKITSVDIPLDTGDFRLINREIVHYLKEMPEKNKFLRGQIAWLGFKQTHVSYTRESRNEGKTGYSLNKMLKFAMDGITSFSDKPLIFVTKMGFLISFFSFVVILYAIYSHFILDKTITGWTSLIISSMFIGGIQLISIGIIGAYISRINTNTKNRPLYIIQDKNCQ